ncbi:MAG: COQ9 family protein [Rhodobacteraceae bacterium]|nr:COQ9 family protein [Paracoccaceae bacterium]
MTSQYDAAKSSLLDAALIHVPFDGWSETTFRAAVSDSGVEPGLARAMFPRGAVDLALAYHDLGDQAMLNRLATTDMTRMKIREMIAFAVRTRIKASEDKEAVRRGMALFALPIHAADGARAIWGTSDLIWNAIRDTSDDYNWYTKRATLSAVYSVTILFWLGDDSIDTQATWDFLDRRIENVMQIEKVKAQVNNSLLLKPFLAAPNWILSHVKAPARMPKMDLPGFHTSPSDES